MHYQVICTTVKSDGIGDFMHFEDIVKAIKANSKFADINFLLLVLFETNEYRPGQGDLYLNFLEKTQKLNCLYLFGDFNDHVCELNVDETKKILNKTEQVLIISYDKLFFYFYEKYTNKNAIIKFIPEHDYKINSRYNYLCEFHGMPTFQSKDFIEKYKIKYSREVSMQGMGLSSNCNGIKIKNIPNFSCTEVFKEIENYAPDLLKKIYSSTNTGSLEELKENYLIVCAYYNNQNSFLNFVDLILNNQSICNNKNIIIYHSGSELSLSENNFNSLNLIGKFNNEGSGFVDEVLESSFTDKYTSVPSAASPYNIHSSVSFRIGLIKDCEIKLYLPEQQDPILIRKSKSEMAKKIFIFSKFNISSEAYQAMFMLSELVGVSGDNTFELAVSTKTLPIYWSTNYTLKKQTFLGLKKVVTDIGLKNKSEFIDFFTLCANHIVDSNEYANINFAELRESWPVIADHLKKHHNFYDKIEEIVSENITRYSRNQKKASASSSIYGLIANWFGMFSSAAQANDSKPLRHLPI